MTFHAARALIFMHVSFMKPPCQSDHLRIIVALETPQQKQSSSSKRGASSSSQKLFATFLRGQRDSEISRKGHFLTTKGVTVHKTKKGLLKRNRCASRFPHNLSLISILLYLINDFGVALRSSCHHKEPTTPSANAVASTRIPYTMPSMPLKHVLPKLNALGTLEILCLWRCGHAVHGDIKLKTLRNKLARMNSTLHHVCLNRFAGNTSFLRACPKMFPKPLNHLHQIKKKTSHFNVTLFSWIKKPPVFQVLARRSGAGRLPSSRCAGPHSGTTSARNST